MLKPAYYYKQQIQEEYKNIVGDSKYKFYFCCSYWGYEFGTFAETSWYDLEFVSLDESGNVIGFMRADIDRESNKIKSLGIINFKNKGNVTFSKDLHKFLFDLFNVHKFRKIEFSVIVGNPIEKMYDKYCLKYGGHIVGQYKGHVKLTDGNLYGYKLYEIFKEDFDKNCILT